MKSPSDYVSHFQRLYCVGDRFPGFNRGAQSPRAAVMFRAFSAIPKMTSGSFLRTCFLLAPASSLLAFNFQLFVLRAQPAPSMSVFLEPWLEFFQPIENFH
jgi:hypothetical protein